MDNIATFFLSLHQFPGTWRPSIAEYFLLYALVKIQMSFGSWQGKYRISQAEVEHTNNRHSALIFYEIETARIQKSPKERLFRLCHPIAQATAKALEYARS